MKNHHYVLKSSVDAEELAEDLRLQLEINRFSNYSITPIPSKNKLIVQVPDADGPLEETVDIFMADYRKTEALE
ncbi:hypothetical protein [Peribacillus sp. SCS-37]|uniref:hypothetical protein n=1 Tax=Paraperibacillus esterisolvens TaxID=3115296 RepID=UPI003905F60D